QVIAMRFECLSIYPSNIHQLMVAAIHKIVRLIQHIGKTARHTGTEIHTRCTQYSYHAAGHIFAAVITGTLDNDMSTRVTHTAACASSSRRKYLSSGGAVQTGVTHNAGVI